jgi:gluconokinase
MNKEKRINNLSSLIVVMGVSGSGKSHIANKLSTTLDFSFVEADDFHSDEAKNNMAANIPITDEVRQFWVDIIYHHLKSSAGMNIVLAFSGLKYKHRDLLRKLPFNTDFIWLDGSSRLIKARLKQRKNHFVSSDFLVGQLHAMEVPLYSENNVYKVDINNELESIVKECLTHLDILFTDNNRHYQVKEKNK